MSLRNVRYVFTAIRTGFGRRRLVELEGADIWTEIVRIQDADRQCAYEFHRLEKILIDGVTVWAREKSITVAYVNEHRLTWVQSTADIAGDPCLAVHGNHETDIGQAEPRYERLRIQPLREEGLSERTLARIRAWRAGWSDTTE